MLFRRKKATGHVPSFQRKYIPLPKGFADWGSLGRAQWTPRRYDALADEGYSRNVVAFRCIRDIAAGVASLPLLLFRRRQELSEHALLTLLARPNPQQGGQDLRETLASQLLMAGNAYLEAVGENAPLELWPLRPDRMQVIAGSHGLPQGYEYHLNGQKNAGAATLCLVCRRCYTSKTIIR